MDRVLVLAVAVLVVMAGGARASTTARLVDATVARPALVGGGVLVAENNTIPILARAGSYYAVAPTSSNQVISKDSYDCMRTSYGVRYALVRFFFFFFFFFFLVLVLGLVLVGGTVSRNCH